MPHLPRYPIVRAWLAACLALGATPAQGDNVLLIIADDLGTDAVGVYAESTTPPPTPNIDALAQAGVLFRNAYSNPLCSPTRATIFTGRYSFRTGVGYVILPDTANVLHESEFTLPEVLDAVNYNHALIGKWHLGNVRNGGDLGPNIAGFSHFAGLIGWGTDDYYLWRRIEDGLASFSSTYTTTDLVDSALSWIRRTSEPWVCTVSLNAPHLPLHTPPQHLHNQNLSGPNTGPHDYFRAMVEAMDTEIGRMLNDLPTGVRERTNVIFVADNGTDGLLSQPPFRSEHAKFTLYEGGINVPLIVSGPIVNSPGREVDALVSTTDLFHTIGDLAGVDVRTVVPPHVRLDGISIVPHLRYTFPLRMRETVYAEQFNAIVGDNGVAIRNDRFKLIRKTVNGREIEEFYDLESDPFETRELLQRRLNDVEREHYRRLLVELARVKDEPAWVPFADGCAGTAGVPELRTRPGELPRIDSSFTTETRKIGRGAITAAGLMGFSLAPLDLRPLGFPNCTLFPSPDAVDPLTITADRTALWPLNLPGEPAILGLTFFQQVAVLDIVAGRPTLSLSNPAHGIVGR